MCKLCNNINDLSQGECILLDDNCFFLSLPSWDCFDDEPSTMEYEIEYCPKCGKNLKEKCNV